MLQEVATTREGHIIQMRGHKARGFLWQEVAHLATGMLD